MRNIYNCFISHQIFYLFAPEEFFSSLLPYLTVITAYKKQFKVKKVLVLAQKFGIDTSLIIN